MSIIKQISVYNGNSWEPIHDIGANATNVSLSTNAAGANNVQGALNNLVGTTKLTGDRAVITNTNGQIIHSSVTKSELEAVKNVSSDIIQINHKIDAQDTTISDLKKEIETINGIKYDNQNLIRDIGQDGSIMIPNTVSLTYEKDENILMCTNFTVGNTNPAWFCYSSTPINFEANKTYYFMNVGLLTTTNPGQTINNPNNNPMSQDGKKILLRMQGDYYTFTAEDEGQYYCYFYTDGINWGGFHTGECLYPIVRYYQNQITYNNSTYGTLRQFIPISNFEIFTALRKMLKFVDLNVTYNDSIQPNTQQRIDGYFDLPSPYTQALGFRQITTNHQNALVLTSFGIDNDGAIGNRVNFFAVLKNVTSSPVAAGTKVKFESFLYSPVTTNSSTAKVYQSLSYDYPQ